jgi:hypothetical protein
MGFLLQIFNFRMTIGKKRRSRERKRRGGVEKEGIKREWGGEKETKDK